METTLELPQALTYAALKQRHRDVREHSAEFLNLRVHRSLSWLNRAEQCDDDDGAYVFLWIAFNAAYANDSGHVRPTEMERFGQFIQRIVSLDKQELLSDLVWQQYSQAIRVLLDNPYVYQRYWDFHNQKPGVSEWEDSFYGAKQKAHKALAQQRTDAVLNIVVERLYTLRNQLVHGGATWNSSVNRNQLRDGKRILASLVPAVISIMLDRRTAHWGEPYYPVRG